MIEALTQSREAQQLCKVYAVLRVRGTVGTPPDVEYTLRLMRLHKPHHMTIYLIETPGLAGMLRKVKDWATWGELDLNTLRVLIERRGEAPGGRRITDEYVRERLGLSGLEELCQKVCSGEIRLNELKGFVEPVFRLRPPRGGYGGSVKRPYKEDGALGYRGPAINELIKRML